MDRKLVATVYYAVETDESLTRYLRDVYVIPDGPSAEDAIEKAIEKLLRLEGVYSDAIRVEKV